MHGALLDTRYGLTITEKQDQSVQDMTQLEHTINTQILLNAEMAKFDYEIDVTNKNKTNQVPRMVSDNILSQN